MKLKTLLSYVIGPVGAGFFGFLLVPFLTWYFETAEIGKYAMFQVYLGLFVLMFTLGLDHSYVRFFHETKNKSALFFNSIAISLSFSVVVLFVINIIKPSFVSTLVVDSENTLQSLMISGAFIICLLLRFVPLVLRMNEQALKYSIIDLLQKGLYFFVILAFVSLLLFKPDIQTLILAYLMSGTVAVCLALYLARRYFHVETLIQFDRSHIEEYLKYGLPLALTGFASWGLIYADRFMLKALESFEVLGIYTVSVSISGVVSVVTAVFSIVWAPAVYKWVAAEVSEKIMPDLCELVCYVSVLVLCVIGSFSWLLSYFLPVNYHAITYFFALNVSIHIYYVLSEAFGIGINISKKTYLLTLTTVISCLVNVLLCSLLISAIGMEGAAISSSISALLFFIIRAELSIYTWKKIHKRRLYAYPIFVFIIMFFQSIYGRDNNGFFIVSFVILAGLMGYLAINLIVKKDIIALSRQGKKNEI